MSGNFRKRKFQNSSWKDNRPKSSEYRHQNQLTETDVGITEYLNTQFDGFSAVIKARYSDFHVNEIDLEGNVARLTDTKIPPFEAKLADYKETEASPSEYLPQEKWEGIKRLVESEGDGEPVVIDAEGFDKHGRYSVHTVVKNYFGKKVVANTVEEDGKKVIVIKKYSKGNAADWNRFQWPKGVGEYVHFILYKEGMDTMEAITKISDKSRVSASNFTYAGVKDRRAKTTQWVCVRQVEPWKLIKKPNCIKGLKVGNLTFKDKGLKLGQLSGNKFRVALRNVLASDDLIEGSIELLKKNGFINYFGLQRFGNDKEAPTFEIGRQLLLGNWKEAVEIILKPKESDDPSQPVSQAKKIYKETEDVEKAVDVVKNVGKQVEVRLLEGLAKSKENDYVTALESIPKNMRLLYIHSFQSLIWNQMVSKRLQLFGTVPVVGDFVVEDESLSDKGIDTESCEDQNNENVGEKTNIKVLTEDDLPKYSIYDVVLPLPGFNVTYPDNVKQYYKESLEEFGLTLEMTRQKVKTYSVKGNYRCILCKADITSWKTIFYKDPTDTLILSDFEELKGISEPQSVEDGEYKALILSFNLPPSSYATMLLRELLKTNTSSSAQAKLNNYQETKQKQKIETVNDEGKHTQETQDNTVKSSSLLADPEKYAEFKNAIFKDILDETKQNEGSDCKKMKVDNGED